MNDPISRQAAIDGMQEYWRSLNLRRKRIPLAAEAVYMDLMGVVATLPSAQPETHDKRTETHGVCLDNLIKRTDAIDVLERNEND